MVKEFVTYWGPSLNDWGEKQERHVIDRDEELLKDGHVTGGRRMKKISLNEIFEADPAGFVLEGCLLFLIMVIHRRRKVFLA